MLKEPFPHLDERYIDTLGEEQLRYELKYEVNRFHALMRAFRELPEVPDQHALHALSALAKHERDWHRGKLMQSERSVGEIPPVSECETGAGLWSIIRPALIAAGEETGSWVPNEPDARSRI